MSFHQSYVDSLKGVKTEEEIKQLAIKVLLAEDEEHKKIQDSFIIITKEMNNLRKLLKKWREIIKNKNVEDSLKIQEDLKEKGYIDDVIYSLEEAEKKRKELREYSKELLFLAKQNYAKLEVCIAHLKTSGGVINYGGEILLIESLDDE